MEEQGPKFKFDDPAVLGKVVLIGVTYVGSDGEETGRAQWWGTILAFNMREGLKVDLRDSGQPHAFPPFENGLRAATPGRYQLRSTGEVIHDPDFLYTLQRLSPPN